jgi:fucose 4-O-acetylase-like acetyltransferase
MANQRRAVGFEGRAGWIDTARGIGIFLVVYGHALRGAFHAGVVGWSSQIGLQDRLIYSFHMPFFFFLSGLFAGRKREGRIAFLQRRAVTILYPYLLWSTVQTLLSIAGSRYANRPGRWSDLLQIGIHPIGQFWFLYVLGMLQLLLLLPRPIFLMLVPVGPLLVLVTGQNTLLPLAGWSLPFFAAGVVLGRDGLETVLPTPRAASAWLVGGLIAFLLLFETASAPTEIAGLLEHYARASAGILVALSLARLIDGRVPLLGMLGMASLSIYVLHVICGALVRAVLHRLGLDQPFVVIAVVTIGGLLIPLAIYLAAIRLGLTPWLGLGFPPKVRSRASEGGTSARPLDPGVRNADVGADQPKGSQFP